MFSKKHSISWLIWDERETKHMSIAALHCSQTEVFFKRQKHIEFRKVFYKVFNVFFPSTVPEAIYSQELPKNTNELYRPKVQFLFSFYVQSSGSIWKHPPQREILWFGDVPFEMFIFSIFAWDDSLYWQSRLALNIRIQSTVTERSYVMNNISTSSLTLSQKQLFCFSIDSNKAIQLPWISNYFG